MTYRKWTYMDILKISEIEKECFQDPWSFQMLADSFSSDNFFGVCAENRRGSDRLCMHDFLRRRRGYK